MLAYREKWGIDPVRTLSFILLPYRCGDYHMIRQDDGSPKSLFLRNLAQSLRLLTSDLGVQYLLLSLLASAISKLIT